MKTTTLVRSLLILMLLTATGCGDWSRRSSQSGLLIEPADAARLGYAVTWSTGLDVPRRNDLSSATVLGDTLFTVETPGNLVTAVSIRDGEVLWRRVIGQPTENIYPPIRDEEKVHFNNDTTFFTVSLKNGGLIATSALSHVVETGPVMIGRYAIFGSADGTVFAHDIDAGYAKWSYQLSAGIVVSPAESQQNVFAVDRKGVYASLAADTGELVFRGRTFGPVTAPPASTRNGLYIPSHDQSLYAINRVTGGDKWVYRTSKKLTDSPAALGQSVFLPLPETGMVALKDADGSESWKTDLKAQAVGISGSKVLLQYPGGMRWVDEDSGRVLSDAPTMPLQFVIPVQDEGGLLIVSPGGRIHRLVPKR
jgi:outer membrane protein assembly factor BamB